MTPYEQFEERDLPLRDYLALERTVMSNERTLLSYWRTGLALSAAGFTAYHFVSNSIEMLISAVMAVAGVAVAIVGSVRFRVVKKRLDVASATPPSRQTE